MLFGLKGTHTRKQINRAALEAVGYSTLQHMILFDEMNLPPKSVITAGGGTKKCGMDADYMRYDRKADMYS